MLVTDILFESARKHPGMPAVWFEGQWRTYGEIDAAARAFAEFLTTHGIRPGDRVAILLDNSFDYVVAHFGALAAGAVEVSLNTGLKSVELKALLLDCEAAALIAGRRDLHRYADIFIDLPGLRLLVSAGASGGLSDAPGGRSLHFLDEISANPVFRETPVSRLPGELASIVYTSGSTGRPKGVMLSHLNLVSNMRSIAGYLGLLPSDRMLVVLPFHYIFGRSLLYTHFLTGGSIVIDNRFAFPGAVLRTMEEQDVTCLAGVPSTFSILLRKTDASKRRFPHLRLVTQAGGAMPSALQQEVAAAFHPASLYIMYGSTEASPRLTYLEPCLLPQKWGSIGRGIPGVEVIVADKHGRRLPSGEHGEIIARGPNIMMGYWKDPSGTAEVIREGWYFTGDLGYEDEDGCLYITGRARDFIKTGGNRVSAGEIEERLSELEEVVAAAVIGVPDEILGEAIKAFVVPRDGLLTEIRVRAHLQRRLAPHQQPKFIEIIDHLPQNQAGKILKAALRERSPAAPVS